MVRKNPWGWGPSRIKPIYIYKYSFYSIYWVQYIPLRGLLGGGVTQVGYHYKGSTIFPMHCCVHCFAANVDRVIGWTSPSRKWLGNPITAWNQTSRYPKYSKLRQFLNSDASSKASCSVSMLNFGFVAFQYHTNLQRKQVDKQVNKYILSAYCHTFLLKTTSPHLPPPFQIKKTNRVTPWQSAASSRAMHFPSRAPEARVIPSVNQDVPGHRRDAPML